MTSGTGLDENGATIIPPSVVSGDAEREAQAAEADAARRKELEHQAMVEAAGRRGGDAVSGPEPRALRELRAHTRTDQPRRYDGPAISREHIMRLLVDHGVWQDIGTVRASQLATAIADLINPAPSGTPAGEDGHG